MSERSLYLLDLISWSKRETAVLPEGLSLKTPNVSDLDGLAELMIESYRGTIDYDGESIEDAVSEVEGYFKTRRDTRPILNYSVVLCHESKPISGYLMSYWIPRDCVIVGYLMTLPLWKRKGLAAFLLNQSLWMLKEDKVSAI